MIALQDVHVAREKIADIIHKTPILSSEQLSKLCNNELLLKSEHLQKTGSFKIRGATNKVKQVAKEGASYVTAASSGNHGQAVAYIAHRMGIPATIVVPEDTRQCKINGIKSYGGTIEKCGTTSGERIPRAKELATQKNGIYIPPYDDPYIMAGQGTVGLEILEQVPDVDAILVPVGGGGLLAGVLTAVKESNPRVKVFAIEPEQAQDTYLSLQKKERITIPVTKTIADGLRTNQPGELTFPVLMKYLDDIILVSEHEIREAFTFVLERMKQMIEPSSATTIAAAMFNKLPFQGKRVVTIISGGNVDIAQLPDLIVEEPAY